MPCPGLASCGDRSDAFFRLFGDGDGDREVDVDDLFAFFGTFGLRAGHPDFLDYFDHNGDGVVGLTDLLAFVERLGTVLEP